MSIVIAIDIDGTLTAKRDHLPKETIDFLSELAATGHTLLFVTGRTLFWSLHLLEGLHFEYYLGVLNGAFIIHMPTKRELAESTVKTRSLQKVLSIVQPFDVGVIVIQHSDSYFYPAFASPVIVNHLEARQKALKENCLVVDTLPKSESLAIRLFCLPHTANELHCKIEEQCNVEAPRMTDSFDSCFSVVQVTNRKASKGNALKTVCKELQEVKKVIACGDDYNDISMLQQADCAVVMNTAPKEVLLLADIIAPAAKENGIITGIKEALKTYA